MKCFVHDDQDAVGICKTCQKGVCRECAVDVGNGIACKGACEDEVRRINSVLDRSKTIIGRQNYAAGIYALFAAILLFYGFNHWYESRTFSYFLMSASLVFFLFSFLTIYRKRKD